VKKILIATLVLLLILPGCKNDASVKTENNVNILEKFDVASVVNLELEQIFSLEKINSVSLETVIYHENEEDTKRFYQLEEYIKKVIRNNRDKEDRDFANFTLRAYDAGIDFDETFRKSWLSNLRMLSSDWDIDYFEFRSYLDEYIELTNNAQQKYIMNEDVLLELETQGDRRYHVKVNGNTRFIEDFILDIENEKIQMGDKEFKVEKISEDIPKEILFWWTFMEYKESYTETIVDIIKIEYLKEYDDLGIVYNKIDVGKNHEMIETLKLNLCPNTI
jgi:hypothetical protein